MQHYLIKIASPIYAKIIGIILIILGIIFILNSNSLNLKIGFASILIGIFMIIMITKKSIPKKISDGQIEGNIDVVKRIVKNLRLTGNAIFLGKNINLTDERIFIPPTNSKIIQIPNIGSEDVFLTGLNGENLELMSFLLQ